MTPELVWVGLIWLGFALAAAALVAVCRVMRVRLLPAERPEPPAVRAELVIAATVLFLLLPGLLVEGLRWSGFFDAVYGPPTGPRPPENTDLRPKLELIWASVLAAPLQIAGILGVLALGGVRPGQVGLSARRIGPNVAAGSVGWVALTPVVFGVWFLARLLHDWLTNGPPRPHILEQIAQAPLSGADRLLFVLAPVVAAPVVEELLFRGVIQGWMLRLSRPGHPAWAVCGSALVFALCHATVWPTPVPLFVLGLGLGWLTYRTGSLVGPMVLHSLFNGVSCVELLLRVT